MKIKMLTRMAGPTVNRLPGDVVDVEAAEAESLIGGGFAELVVEPKAEPDVVASPEAVIESAAVEPEAERAVVAANPRRRRGL